MAARGESTPGGDQLPDDWDASYAGTPPWDIGRPQKPFVELAHAGQLYGAVLELGCGTGERTLLAAGRGLQATGVDLAPTAIARARTKARQRGLDARFLVRDALTVDALGETFDVVLDCGFFHVLSDPAHGLLAEVLRREMCSRAATAGQVRRPIDHSPRAPSPRTNGPSCSRGRVARCEQRGARP